jgi:hypothetical protein
VRVFLLQSPSKLYLTADPSQQIVNYVGIVVVLMCVWKYLHGSDENTASSSARGSWSEQSNAGRQQQDQLAGGHGVVSGRGSSAATRAQALLLHVMQPQCAYFLAIHMMGILFNASFLLDQ